MSKARFDPAAHLHKHGWKGKGTALKQGHATRHIAVSQKKTLSGLGKDRDEAIPFWDHIFAATAASLSIPSSGTSTPLSASASSSPVPLLQKNSGAWQTHTAPTVSVTARVGRESARRGLYSRFLRGAVVSETPDESTPEEPPAIHEPESVSEQEAGPSSPRKDKREGETKEERRARRAAKAARKADKEKRKERKRTVDVLTEADPRGVRSAADETLPVDLGKETRKKKRKASNEAESRLEHAPSQWRQNDSSREDPSSISVGVVNNDGGDDNREEKVKAKRKKRSHHNS